MRVKIFHGKELLSVFTGKPRRYIKVSGTGARKQNDLQNEKEAIYGKRNGGITGKSIHD